MTISRRYTFQHPSDADREIEADLHLTEVFMRADSYGFDVEEVDQIIELGIDESVSFVGCEIYRMEDV